MLVRILLAALFLVGTGRSARACINDRESPGHEREFRSNYDDPGRSRTQPVPRPSPPPLMAGWSGPVVAGVGGVLLTSAFFLVIWPRARS